MNKIRLNTIISLVVFIVMLSGCKKDKDDNENTTPVTPPVITETIIATASGTIGTAGGTVKLSDGATVEIAAGVLTSDTKITIKKIGNEVNFAADNRYCYEITGVEKGVKVKLIFPCAKNKPLEHIGVYNYNPETNKGILPSFTYDAAEGKIIVDNYTLSKKNKAGLDYQRWIMEWNDAIATGDTSRLIPTPFYEQVIGTCWAADGCMLAKSYLTNSNKEVTESSMAAFMKYMHIGIDEGVTLSVLKQLVPAFRLYSGGVNAKTECYYNTNNLLKTIIDKLSKDIPVIIFMPNRGHAVLIVGFRGYVNSSGKKDWDLVIHDSKATFPAIPDEGGMYTNRNWSWFLQNDGIFNTIGILYPEKAVSKERSLQTILMPTSEQPLSYITFTYKGTGSPGTIYLKNDINAEFNHVWVNSQDKVLEPLPITITKLNLKLMIYNADMDASWFGKEGIVKLTIFNRDKNKSAYDKEFTFGMPSSSREPTYFIQSIDTNEWHKNTGDTSTTHYFLKVRMLNKETKAYIDGFTVFFNVKNYKYNYINNYAFTPAAVKFTQWNQGFKANLSASLTGDKFRVTREKTDADAIKVTVNVPPMPANASSYSFNLNLKYLDIELEPTIPLASVFLDKGVLSWSGSNSSPLDNTGNWTIPLTLEKGWSYKTYVVSVYPKITDPDQGTWGTVYAHEVFTIEFVFDK